jgi:coenzyme F420-0:L-glutamate ligase/coenzyme F420-1:gamma-L-glutamate ligase
MLALTPLTGLPLVQAGDDLVALVNHSLQEAGLVVQDGDILVLAQKIISKAEGRLVDLATITPSREAHALAVRAKKDPRVVELILQESRVVMRTRPGLIVVEHRLGFVCANAGIDHSNVLPPPGAQGGDWVLLLPEDPDSSARRFQAGIESLSGARSGVLVIDSHGRAWRLGTVGIAIGLAEVPGLLDLRGVPDIGGVPLQVTQVGVADELAAAASLVMGQAAERIPAVHVRGFPYGLRQSSLRELMRPEAEDLFR